MRFIDRLNQFAKFLLLMVVILVPTVAYAYGTFNYKLVLMISLYGVIVERIWFSLFTTKEGKAKKNTTNDWTLILVTYTYLAYLGAIFYDLFQFDHSFSLLGMTVGFLLMLISYVVRNWSVSHLGEQWASHLEVNDNVGRYLIRSGPYAYMRHPIYTAAIVEFIGMQCLFGGDRSFLVLCWLGIPSIILRSLYEERVAGAIFGNDYFRYMDETGRFFPCLKYALGLKQTESNQFEVGEG